MLFKLLKLFGLDVPAKVAAAKLVIEQRAEEVAQYVGQTVQTSAVIAALSALAGVLGAMAVGVGLYALYLVDADAYGVYAGLGVVGGVLVAAVLILLLVVWAKGQSLSRRRIFKPLSPSATAASSSAPVVAAAMPAPDYAPRQTHTEPARDLLEPLALLLPKYIKYPALGHPVLDWKTSEPQRTAPPMRPWRGRRISCAMETENSSSPCWAVPCLSAGFWHDKILISDWGRRLNNTNPPSSTPRDAD